MAGIHNDEVVPKLRELTDAVHRHGGAILAQINYGGYQASAGERMGPSDYNGEGLEGPSHDDQRDLGRRRQVRRRRRSAP